LDFSPRDSLFLFGPLDKWYNIYTRIPYHRPRRDRKCRKIKQQSEKGRRHGERMSDHLLEQIIIRLERIDTRIEGLENRIDSRFEEVNAKFEEVNTRFEEVNAKFDEVNARIDKVNVKLEKIEYKLDITSEQVARNTEHNSSFDDLTATVASHSMDISLLKKLVVQS
jgi:predicted  nucleic acid-binding Zn-ribbon protein